VEEEIQPGMAFRFNVLNEGNFIFAFPSTTTGGQGLFKKLNLQGGFLEKEWYRSSTISQFVTRAKDFDII